MSSKQMMTWPQIGDRGMTVVEVELIPELFRRMSMHPAEAALIESGERL